ncbi:MAG: protein kinase [Calditrichaceae bacterium]
MIGQNLLHYKIIEKLGEGEMGVVYLAEDTKLSRKVALKFLTTNFIEDTELTNRFKREAMAAACLNHPNIITVFDVGEIDKKNFIAMEYVAGTSLRQLLDRQKLSLEKTIDICCQICSGLKKAHSAGITHRDIKPSNILLDSDGLAKIADFGLAKIEGATKLTKKSSTFGSIQYMSPEQFQSADIDARSDIYSTGVVLYEMITGRTPFDGAYTAAVTFSILHENPEPLARYREGISDELQRIVSKALAKDLNIRYQHIDDFLADLEALRKHLREDRKEIPRPSGQFVLNKRKVLNTAIVIFCIIVGVLMISLWQSSNDDSSKQLFSNKIRIAVLPLTDISQDRDDNYFVEGMTEEVINNLSKIRAIRVIAQTSVMQYKNSKKSIAEIGSELKVTHIIEGSVRKADNRLRITFQLIDVNTQEYQWSKNYDRNLGDIFAVQSDVAFQVANSLSTELLDDEKRQLTNQPTNNFEAYTLYLKGRAELRHFTEGGNRKALQYFSHAIEIDPDFAEAYAGLSNSYHQLSNIYLPPEEAMPKAMEAAIKAIELNNSLAEAHSAIASVRAFYDWDWLTAGKEFKRAIELNPSSATSHHHYGIYLLVLSRFKEAIYELNQAKLLDPRSISIQMTAILPYYYGRQYRQTIEETRKIIEIHPHFIPANQLQASSYQYLGETSKAIEIFKISVKYSDRKNDIAYLGQAYAAAGLTKEARMILEKLLTQQARGDYVRPDLIAMVYISLGDLDQAFAWLEKAYQQRTEELILINIDPLYDSVRTDKRFIALLKKMGFINHSKDQIIGNNR